MRSAILNNDRFGGVYEHAHHSQTNENRQRLDELLFAGTFSPAQSLILRGSKRGRFFLRRIHL